VIQNLISGSCIHHSPHETKRKLRQMPRHISQQVVSPAEGQTLFEWVPQSKSSFHTHRLPSDT